MINSYNLKIKSRKYKNNQKIKIKTSKFLLKIYLKNKFNKIKKKFKDFDNEVLDDLAEEYYQKLNSYPKEMKKWEIVNSVK